MIDSKTKTIKFITLEKTVFPKDSMSLETRLNGDIVLEFEHMKSEEEEYFVHLQIGRCGFFLGKFKDREDAKRCYDIYLNALKDGGRISVGVTGPIKIYDSQGNLIGNDWYF